MVSARDGGRLCADGDELEAKTTQAFRRPALSAAEERARRAQAVPHAFSRSQLVDMLLQQESGA
jgi:hypothetical protein